MCEYKIDAEVVLRAARGHWKEILLSLAPTLKQAIEAAPAHVSCPLHGGKNGFRFFSDFAENGNCICNTCGFFDGLHLLMQANGISFFEALKAVNDFLRLPSGSSIEGEPITYEGKIIFLGMMKTRRGEAFAIKIRTEKDVQTLFGEPLRRASEKAQLRNDDNARIVLLGMSTITNSNGTWKKKIWACTRLKSDDELRQEEEKALEESNRRERNIEATWNRALPLNPNDETQSPLFTYFENRGILVDVKHLENLRFSFETYYNEDRQKVGTFPCLVSAIRNNQGELITIHRTFLTKEGQKISFGNPKKIMALPTERTINRAFIGLGEIGQDGIVCVSEGIETALSVLKGTGYASLSCITAHGLETFEPPEGVKTVFIFADRDKSRTGQRAAYHLYKRLLDKGIPTIICLPPESLPVNENAKGSDWNDVIRLLGESSFPFRNYAS